MWGIHGKFYPLIAQDQSYEDLLLEAFKVSKYLQGSMSIEYLKNLPLDEFRLAIKTTNKVAEQEKMMIDAERNSGV